MDFLFKHITSILLLVIGLLLMVANWIILYNELFKKKSSSWIPLLGGVFTALGLSTLPLGVVSKFWWVPLIIDYGCLPGMTHTAWFWIFKYPKIKEKNKKTKNL